MAKAQSRQAGFSSIEIVLAVLVIGAMAAIGLDVYQRQRSTTTTNTTQTAIRQTVIQPAPATTYFAIKEWGVRAPYSGTLKLTYTIATAATVSGSATFSSDQLTTADPKLRWARRLHYPMGSN